MWNLNSEPCSWVLPFYIFICLETFIKLNSWMFLTCVNIFNFAYWIYFPFTFAIPLLFSDWIESGQLCKIKANLEFLAPFSCIIKLCLTALPKSRNSSFHGIGSKIIIIFLPYNISYNLFKCNLDSFILVTLFILRTTQANFKLASFLAR